MNTEGTGNENIIFPAMEWGGQGEFKYLPLLPHEIFSIDQKMNRIVYIESTDNAYQDAVNDIRDQAVISVLVEPNFFGRNHRASVIVIATANNTFIFDQSALGTLFQELASVLEAEFPRKVLHYSHRICDLLYKQYNLKLNGISDTFVALCVVRKKRVLCSLPEAISQVLDIPLMELTCEGLTEPTYQFTARPLNQEQLLHLGKLAILQLKLHDRLIYGNICTDLQEMSAKFSSEFYKVEMNCEVVLNMGPASESGFDCIDKFYDTYPLSLLD